MYRQAYKLFILTLAGILGLTMFSCTHEPLQPPVNPNNLICDTLSIKYSTCVQPVFKTNCYQCHSDSASQNGTIAFDMETFSQLKVYLNNYYHNDSIYGSKFMSVIGYRLGVVHMPPDYELPQAEIDIIQNWINKGALNN